MSTTPSATMVKEEVVISNDDEKQQQLPLLAEAARIDEEYVWQLELLLQRFPFYRGLLLPSLSRDGCVKEEVASPSRHRVK